MKAIIKKDISSITVNRYMFVSILVVPLVFTVVLPTIFNVTMMIAPDDPDLVRMLALLPSEMMKENQIETMVHLFLNVFFPVLFLLIPIMSSSIMAASSFVGEKEKQTLETLLYCPLTLKEIFVAKVFASFIFSMAVSLLSFVILVLVMTGESWLMFGQLVLPQISWLIVLLLLCPAIALIAITLIVRGSAKAQTMEESQQRAVFLVFPIIAIIIGQFTGVFFLNDMLLLGLAVVLALASYFLIKSCLSHLDYERLFKH